MSRGEHTFMCLEMNWAHKELVEEFQVFDNWMDRYQYIIDLGKRLPEFPEEWKIEENRIHGCQSQVWFKLEKDYNYDRLKFQATSDSAIVSGLIAILMRVYSDELLEDIASISLDFISELGLDQHLSPTRSNGLDLMIKAIRNAAS